MNRINGWEFYLKIKDLSKREGARMNVATVIRELGIKDDLAREYLTALAVLKFIEFTDVAKEEFLITDLGME